MPQLLDPTEFLSFPGGSLSMRPRLILSLSHLVSYYYPLTIPNLHYTLSLEHLHRLAYHLRNLSHCLRQFRQHTRITQHGQARHGSMRPIRLEK